MKSGARSAPIGQIGKSLDELICLLTAHADDVESSVSDFRCANCKQSCLRNRFMRRGRRAASSSSLRSHSRRLPFRSFLPVRRAFALALALAALDRAHNHQGIERPYFQVGAVPDPLPEDCNSLVAPGAGPAAAVLRPLNITASREPNVTLVACVKNLREPSESAWLHVVSADNGYGPHLSSDNPIPLAPGSTSIVWNNVPMGAHAAFIELRLQGGGAAPHQRQRSKPCIFSRISEIPGRVPGESGGRDTGGEDNEVGEGSDDEWPLLEHLRRMRQQHLDAPVEREPSSPGRCPGPPLGARPLPTRSRKAAEEEWCGVAGWQPVGMHDVVAAFLQAEWYKEEHRVWRGVEPMQSAVRYPDTSDDNQNVLRAMLMATPRKVLACVVRLTQTAASLTDDKAFLSLPWPIPSPILMPLPHPLPLHLQSSECDEGGGADQHAPLAPHRHQVVQGHRR